MADEDVPVEEYPAEIEEYLTEFDSSVDSLHNMVKTMVSVSKTELVQKVRLLRVLPEDAVKKTTFQCKMWLWCNVSKANLGIALDSVCLYKERLNSLQ